MRESHFNEEQQASAISTEVQNPLKMLQERSTQDNRRLQLEDPSIGIILRSKEDDKRPSKDQPRRKGPEPQRLAQLWQCLLVEDGVLKRKFEDIHGDSTWIELVVPQVIRSEILQVLHAEAVKGHLGEEKTLNKVKERFYWARCFSWP